MCIYYTNPLEKEKQFKRIRKVYRARVDYHNPAHVSMDGIKGKIPVTSKYKLLSIQQILFIMCAIIEYYMCIIGARDIHIHFLYIHVMNAHRPVFTGLDLSNHIRRIN